MVKPLMIRTTTTPRAEGQVEIEPPETRPWPFAVGTARMSHGPRAMAKLAYALSQTRDIDYFVGLVESR